MLDQALEMTFPAGDPIAVYVPENDGTMDNGEKETSDSLPFAA